jgi:hypothetical protein
MRLAGRRRLARASRRPVAVTLDEVDGVTVLERAFQRCGGLFCPLRVFRFQGADRYLSLLVRKEM